MMYQQDETAKKQQQELIEFYRNKYPAPVNKADAPDEIKLTAQERYAADQKFSQGLYQSNLQANQEMLNKLQAVFKNKNKGV